MHNRVPKLGMSAELVAPYGLDRRDLVFQTMRQLLNRHLAKLLLIQQPACHVAMFKYQPAIAVGSPNNKSTGYKEGRKF